MSALRLLPLLALALASPALADPIAPSKIIDAAIGDWNKDGRADLALLVAPSDDGEEMGFYGYIRAENEVLAPQTIALAKFWGTTTTDGMFGQQAHMEALPNGSLMVTTQNSGIGRSRWETSLTLAFRNNQFIVAGFTHSYYDTLDENANGDCDLNVLTGKGKSSTGPIKAEPAFIAIEDWNDTIGLRACGIDNG